MLCGIFAYYPVITLYFVVFLFTNTTCNGTILTLMVFNGTIGGIRMSGIFDRRAKRFISTEQAERAVPSRTVMASRVARDDVNRSERVQKKENNIQMDKDDFLLTQIDEFRERQNVFRRCLIQKNQKLRSFQS